MLVKMNRDGKKNMMICGDFVTCGGADYPLRIYFSVLFLLLHFLFHFNPIEFT